MLELVLGILSTVAAWGIWKTKPWSWDKKNFTDFQSNPAVILFKELGSIVILHNMLLKSVEERERERESEESERRSLRII